MLDEGGLGAEALAAVDALEGLLPRVDPLVDVEQGDVGEPLAAEVAPVLKRFHRLVGPPATKYQPLKEAESDQIQIISIRFFHQVRYGTYILLYNRSGFNMNRLVVLKKDF